MICQSSPLPDSNHLLSLPYLGTLRGWSWSSLNRMLRIVSEDVCGELGQNAASINRIALGRDPCNGITQANDLEGIVTFAQYRHFLSNFCSTVGHANC